MKTLLDFMAEACYYAQSHVGDPSVWPANESERQTLLESVSFQMACFFARNTVEGDNGVEWDVVLEKLISTKKDKHGYMVRSISSWKKVLEKIAQELGGWKDQPIKKTKSKGWHLTSIMRHS